MQIDYKVNLKRLFSKAEQRAEVHSSRSFALPYRMEISTSLDCDEKAKTLEPGVYAILIASIIWSVPNGVFPREYIFTGSKESVTERI